VRETQVVVECDGWAAHVLDRRNWERDKVRDADLAAEGYVVVHITYRHIVRHARETAERIRRTLARWAPAVLG
jgi:very-short-patch-repair endonuclease